jgi:hypothetical protein
MTKIYAVLVAFVIASQVKMKEARRDERGLGTLEMVVLGLGLFLAATALIIVVTAAITTRSDQIK